MVFNIHYIADTADYATAWERDEQPENLGNIIAYQEGPFKQSGKEVTKGCELLSFESYQPILDPRTEQICMKVDVETKTLVAL